MGYIVIKKENINLKSSYLELVKYQILDKDGELYLQLKIKNIADAKVNRFTFVYKEFGKKKTHYAKVLSLPGEEFYQKTLIPIDSDEIEIIGFRDVEKELGESDLNAFADKAIKSSGREENKVKEQKSPLAKLMIIFVGIFLGLLIIALFTAGEIGCSEAESDGFIVGIMPLHIHEVEEYNEDIPLYVREISHVLGVEINGSFSLANNSTHYDRYENTVNIVNTILNTILNIDNEFASLHEYLSLRGFPSNISLTPVTYYDDELYTSTIELMNTLFESIGYFKEEMEKLLMSQATAPHFMINELFLPPQEKLYIDKIFTNGGDLSVKMINEIVDDMVILYINYFVDFSKQIFAFYNDLHYYYEFENEVNVMIDKHKTKLYGEILVNANDLENFVISELISYKVLVLKYIKLQANEAINRISNIEAYPELMEDYEKLSSYDIHTTCNEILNTFESFTNQYSAILNS